MKSILNHAGFLKTAGGTLALSAVASGVQSAEVVAPKKRNLKKGFMMSTFPGGKSMSWVEKFKLLKEAGFDGAEPPSHLDQKEILKARDAAGIEIASVVAGPHTRSMSAAAPSIRGQGSEGLKQALRDAKAYGASSVLCVAGHVNENATYADAWERTREEIAKCIPLAEELGVKIAVENVWNNFLLSPLEAARYVDEFKSPAVGWHFDVGNVISIGWPEHWIEILGARIQKLHIKEFSRKKMNEDGLRKGFEVDYLEGDNDWPAVMRALDQIQYQGWCIVEPACGPCKEKVSAEEFVRNVSVQLDKILAS